MSPHVAVTGAAGFIGSKVVALLRESHPEWTVTGLDNFYKGQVREVGDVTIEHVDIRNDAELAAALEGADIVMHLAAISGVDDCAENPDRAHAVNVLGTNHVAYHCRQTGAALVFPFSMAVLGDPGTFPITAEANRAPLNWYGRTKLLGERVVGTYADDAFPAITLLKSNLYGEHEIDGTRVSKGTVINFFVDRVFADAPLTVYDPGSQARNYVHVVDVARAYVRCGERLVERMDRGETGVEAFEIASREDPSVMRVAETVQRIAREETDRDPTVELVENPRGNETLVEEFGVDISRTERELGWSPEHSIESSVRSLIREKAIE